MLTSHLNQIHPFATPAPFHPQTSKPGRVQIKCIKYVSMLIPPLDPPTSVSALGYFFHHLFNRPNVAGAVLQTPSSLIN